MFPDVSASVLYDVLHDPMYRSKWDHYMLEIKDVGHINPNNSINYYARKFSSCKRWVRNLGSLEKFYEIAFQPYFLILI